AVAGTTVTTVAASSWATATTAAVIGTGIAATTLSGDSPSKPDHDEDDPVSVRLVLPPQKARYLRLYRSHLGLLQHRLARDRDTAQQAAWDEHMNPTLGGEMPMETWCWGISLWLNDRDILRPRWTATQTFNDMHVDHRIEMQVTPIGGEAAYDQPWNYELLD